MTNREWFALHPEEITGELFGEILDGYGKSDVLHYEEYVNKYLSAEHKQPEITHVTTIHITKIFKGDMQPITREEQRRLCEMIKQATRADNVTVARIQTFLRGADE